MRTMRRERRLYKALNGLLALWLVAVAVAPVWHVDHEVAPPPEPVAGHEHGGGAYLCDARLSPFDSVVDCVLCAAKRLLSQCWTKAPGNAIAPALSDGPSWVASFDLSSGLHLSVAARAPPVC